jgi:hypothetical protein
MSANDGGNAFPVADYDHQTIQPKDGNECKRQLLGMSLRDYLAAKAVAALEAPCDYVGRSETQRSYREWAEKAYRMADAMLAARNA